MNTVQNRNTGVVKHRSHNMQGTTPTLVNKGNQKLRVKCFITANNITRAHMNQTDHVFISAAPQENIALYFFTCCVCALNIKV